MENLTDMVTTVHEGTSPAKVDEMRAAEAVRAAELVKAGHLVRLWLWRPHSVQANDTVTTSFHIFNYQQ